MVPVVTGITISAPTGTSLRKLEDYHAELTRIQTATPISLPVVIIDDSDSDDSLRYPSDEGPDESDEDCPLTDTVDVLDEPKALFPTTANTCGDNMATDAPTENTGADDTASTADAVDTASEDEGEDKGLKPGAYLECQVCGTIYDFKRRKSGQPWQANYQREAGEIGSGMPYSITIV